MSLLDRTRAAVAQAIEVYQGTAHHAYLGGLRDRLDEPLRVAVAGRVKAGKSTLLNALVGERLAPTDAGECTRIVTWYQDGHTYQVLAEPVDGAPRQLRFHRDQQAGGAIEVDLAGLAPEQVRRLQVSWPSQALRTVTLIDTPGIGSLSDQVAKHTWDLLVPEEEETPADAVLYLMRHLHAGDVDFLAAFHDTEVSAPNPVNAIGVLSRADEVGVGRLDSLASAARVAARLATNHKVRRLVQTVVPVAGLLAETAATVTEAEVGQLRRIADLPSVEAEELLLSADQFMTDRPDLGLTSLEREGLLGRLGLFGIRLATTKLRHKVVSTATELARELTDRSGIGELREVLATLFFARREVLKSRSALLALDSLTRTSPRPGSEAVAAAVEELVSAAHPFRELRVLSAIRAGWVRGKPTVIEDLERLVGGAGNAPAARLQLPGEAGTTEVGTAATQALVRWQRRVESPATSRELALAGRVAIRSCEGILAELTPGLTKENQ